MITSINREFAARQRRIADDLFILESVLGVDEVIPGSDEEMEDVIDVDSVPDDAYSKLDKVLDQIVNSPEYDDSEVEELADDEFDESEVDDSEIDAIMEAVCNDFLNNGISPSENILSEAGEALSSILARQGREAIDDTQVMIDLTEAIGIGCEDMDEEQFNIFCEAISYDERLAGLIESSAIWLIRGLNLSEDSHDKVYDPRYRHVHSGKRWGHDTDTTYKRDISSYNSDVSMAKSAHRSNMMKANKNGPMSKYWKRHADRNAEDADRYAKRRDKIAAAYEKFKERAKNMPTRVRISNEDYEEYANIIEEAANIMSVCYSNTRPYYIDLDEGLGAAIENKLINNSSRKKYDKAQKDIEDATRKSRELGDKESFIEKNVKMRGDMHRATGDDSDTVKKWEDYEKVKSDHSYDSMKADYDRDARVAKASRDKAAKSIGYKISKAVEMRKAKRESQQNKDNKSSQLALNQSVIDYSELENLAETFLYGHPDIYDSVFMENVSRILVENGIDPDEIFDESSDDSSIPDVLIEDYSEFILGI